MKAKTKVRFHLAHGPNYQRWQVRQGDDVNYYDPEDVMLEMHNATLRNQRKTAERINQGENKTVCAWIECDQVIVKPLKEQLIPEVQQFIHYNPRVRPYWYIKSATSIDDTNYDMLATFGRLIFHPVKTHSHVQ